MTESELYHHGVKGMKWGKRKDKYVTVRQGLKNANTAGQDAWRKSVSDNGGKLVGRSKQVALYKNPSDKFRGKKAANDAYRNAYKESIKSDKTYNKQLRSESKPNKTLKTAAAYGALAVTGFLAGYGAMKVSKARQTVSEGLLKDTLAYVNAMNKL